MNCVRKEKIMLLAAVFFFTWAGLLWADNHLRRADPRDTTRTIAADSVAVRDRITQEAVLGRRASAEDTEEWRRRNIQKVIQAQRPGNKAWIRACTENVLAGDNSCTDEIPGFTQSSAGMKAAAPSLASSVGMLLIQKPNKSPMPLCTISLTKANAGLTARHCVDQVHVGDSLKVFFPYEGIRDVDMASINRFELSQQLAANLPSSVPEDDLAMVEFNNPYTIISPEPLDAGSTAASGGKGIVVGYGFDNEDEYDHGIKREASVFLSPCDPQGTGGAATQAIERRKLCFSYDQANPDSIAMMAFDSGGPMFQKDSEGKPGNVIGVARGSRLVDTADSDSGRSVYVNLTDPYYQTWLAESNPSSSVPRSEISFEDLKSEEAGYISPLSQVDYPLDIPELARELIFTLNHQPGPERFLNNLDLQMPQGQELECTRLPTVEICTIKCSFPESFTFTVGWGELKRSDGRPFNAQYDVGYQMTAIALLGTKDDGICTPNVADSSQAVGPNSTGLEIDRG